jgi:hypothetical protein
MGNRREARPPGSGRFLLRLLVGLAGVPSAMLVRLPTVVLWLVLFVIGGVVGATITWYAPRGRAAPRRRRIRNGGHPRGTAGRVAAASRRSATSPGPPSGPGTVYVSTRFAGSAPVPVTDGVGRYCRPPSPGTGRQVRYRQQHERQRPTGGSGRDQTVRTTRRAMGARLSETIIRRRPAVLSTVRSLVRRIQTTSSVVIAAAVRIGARGLNRLAAPPACAPTGPRPLPTIREGRDHLVRQRPPAVKPAGRPPV